MKNGKNKGLTKGNKTKDLNSMTAQVRLDGENLEKFRFLQSDSGLNNSSVLIAAISEHAKLKGYQNN